MARKNRKHREGISTASLTARWLLLAVAAVSFSLLYVWQHVQLVRTGYAIKHIERDLREWRKANEALSLSNERMKTPRRIECMLAEKKLGLIFPREKNIVRLHYPHHLAEQKKEASGTEGGTDTLLSYRSGGGGAGYNRL